jgi:hypothetical protein
MADLELFQGEVSPLFLISPPRGAIDKILQPQWACELGVYNTQGNEKFSRVITEKQMSDVGQEEREYFATYFTEAETAGLSVGEYTVAILMYETSTGNPPKYRKEIHKTLSIQKGLIPID